MFWGIEVAVLQLKGFLQSKVDEHIPGRKSARLLASYWY